MTFPETPLPVRVELFYDNQWNDITTDDDGSTRIYMRDGIEIVRGQSREAGSGDPSSCNLTINNRDGRFSPRNPLSPLFGKIGRNTPLRVVIGDESLPAPSYDATSNSSGDQDLSWTHTPNGDPRGVLVTIVQQSSISDEVARVTYGGYEMDRIDSQIGMIAGRIFTYWLAGGLPVGPQTVVVDIDGTASERHASAVTVTSDHIVEVEDVATAFGSSSANPTISGLDTASEALLVGVLYSSQDSTTDNTPGVGFTLASDFDFGTATASVIRSTSPAAAGTPAVSWVSTASAWRASAYALSSGIRSRFVGEVASWPQQWDQSGEDVWVPITAASITRRLGQGTSVAPFSFRNWVEERTPNKYWPLDDAPGSATGENVRDPGSSKFYGGPSPTSLGPRFEFGNDDMSPLVPSAMTFFASGQGHLRGDVGLGGASTALDFVFKSEGLGVLGTTLRTYNVAEWELELRGDGTNDDIRLNLRQNPTGYGKGGTLTALGNTAPLGAITDGQMHHVRLALVDNGADLDWFVYLDGDVVLSGTRSSYQNDGCSMVRFTYVIPDDNPPVALAHVAVWSSTIPDIDETVRALNKFAGEAAGQRMARLCLDAGIQFASTGGLDDTALMGPQPDDDLIEILQECAETDGGILYEPRDSLGLAYRTRVSLYNQTDELELDYSAGVFSEVPEAVEDDQLTRNDVTATSSLNGRANAVLTEGPLSIQDPPLGVSRYPTSVSRNVSSNAALPDQAAWALHLGTIDEARYPQIVLNLAREVFTSDAALTEAIVALEQGGLIAITNMPPWIPPGDIKQLVMGYRESLSNFEWSIAFNGRPASAFEVAEYDVDRYDTIGSELATGIDADDTSLSVEDSSSLGSTLWTTDDAAFPLDIYVGGEQMTVSDITGTSSPQTFTVTRGVNGITKSHAAGTAVRLWKTPRYAL